MQPSLSPEPAAVRSNPVGITTDAADARVPLFVDLDGSLLRSDLLVESALKLVKADVTNVARLARWWLEGKASLKTRIAAQVDLDVGTLPYDPEVVALARNAREQGRRVVLATASHRKYAEAVAAHLGLFDAVLATDESVNLNGERKLAAIRADAGGPFHYVGNGAVDMAIWKDAAGAVVVSSARSLAERAAAVTRVIAHVRPPAAGIGTWLRAIRLHQWAKNVLIFLPALPIAAALSASAWWALVLALVVFGFCASSVYLLNDVLDLEADRAHPRKRERPIPAGRISLVASALGGLLLWTVAFAVAWLWLPLPFVGVLGAYWLCTLTYSLGLKRRVLVDVMMLAWLYTLRIVAGAAVIGVMPSFWILAFSVFLFLSLAAAKRYVEMGEMQRQNRDRVAGRGYMLSDIHFVLSLGVSSGMVSILVFSLYVNDPTSKANLAHPHALWLVCPLLLYWITRIWLKATRGELHYDPLVFAFVDRISRAIGLLCALLFAAALFGWPAWD